MSDQIFSRRQFLKTSVVAAGSMAFSRLEALAADPYAGFKMGAQSYSLRHFDLEPCLERMQKLGLHYVEFFDKHSPITTDAQKIADLKAKCAKYEVTPLAFGVTGFNANEAENRRKFEFAKLLGLKSLSANPDPNSFASLDKLVEEFGIAIAIHNHGPEDKRYGKIDQIAKAIEGHHKLIGTCVDTGHFIRSNEDPVKAVRTFGERTHGVHLKDVKTLDGGGKKFCITGLGDLDTVALFRELKKLKFANCLSLEYEENPQDPVADMEQCLKVAREAAAKL